MSDYEDFGGPAWSPDLFLPNGRLARLHKGGGNGAAIEEQRAARLQSAAQFKEQMALMRQQYEDAQKVKTPAYVPASAPQEGSPDVVNAGMEMRRRMQRRFGSAATRMYRPTPQLGGAVPLAA